MGIYLEQQNVHGYFSPTSQNATRKLYMSKIKSIALSLAIAAVSTVGVSQTAHADNYLDRYDEGHDAGWLWYQILRTIHNPLDAFNTCHDLAGEQVNDGYQDGFYVGCTDAAYYYDWS